MTCPHCGAVVWPRRNYCPHCGRSTRPGWEEGLRLLAAVGLVLLAAPFGLATGCTALSTVFSLSAGDAEDSLALIGFGLVFAFITFGLIRGAIMVSRQPKRDD